VRKRFVVMGLLALAGYTSRAAEPAADPKPRMTERGKLLFSDDLNKPFAKEWKAAKGKWEVVDGAMRGCELKDDMHGAVSRHPVEFQNAVIQFSFRIDGARVTTLSINGAKGHVCRVLMRPNGFTVQKDDQDGKNGPDTAAQLQTCETPIKAGEWHTMLLEIHGKEMLATLDGKHTAYGEHAAVDKPKANIGLTVGGESVSFKNLRVWEATQNKEWEKEKSKLKKK
jgi:3-keto-disaccharide hydrolase